MKLMVTYMFIPEPFKLKFPKEKLQNLIFTLKDNMWEKIQNEYSVKFYNLLTVLLLGSQELLQNFVVENNF